MTIDEAIIHAEEKAEKLRCFCEKHEDDRDLGFVRRSEKCAEEHRQLADWLRELKELREKTKEWRDDFKSYVNALDMPRDDYNGIMEYIDEAPSVQPEQNFPSQMSGTSDTVSRNSIIRALNTMDRYIADELTLCDTDRKFPKNEVFIVDDVYEEIVEQLPSVQREPYGGEQ